MRLDRRFKIEAAASKDTTRQHICHPHLDVEGKRLLACNGFGMAIVPCEVEDGDESGLVPAGAVNEARGMSHVKAAADRVLCVGVTYERPKDQFPPIEQVLPSFKEGDPGTVTVALTTDYLVAVAKALGSTGKGGQVALTILLPKAGEPALAPILVRSLNAAGATGLLMPVIP